MPERYDLDRAVPARYTGAPGGDSATEPTPPSRRPAYLPANGPTGEVLAAGTDIPMGGVRVQWLIGTPAANDRDDPDDMAILGEAITDTAGSFTIALAETPAARSAHCRLAASPDGAVAEYVRAADGADAAGGDGAGVVALTRLDSRRGPLVLRIPAGVPVADDAWAPLADFLEANRMYAVGDLQDQLAAPTRDGPARGWPVRARATALAAMHEVLARAVAGRPASDEAALQESFVELAILRAGRLPDAIGAFLDPASLPTGLGDKWQPWNRAPRTELELYRDYLRGVWVSAAQRMYHDSYPAFGRGPDADADALQRQLDVRFHQNFRTNDVAPQPTARLAAAVLRAALVGDRTREGFGLAAAAVPTQGAQGDEEYLRTLVALSRVRASELRNRFRIPFDAPPGDARSPVQLNVDALLGLLTDTYQSPREPFTALPRAVTTDDGQSLIFGRGAPGLGVAPFFLHLDEWRARQERFHPENAFDVRRTAPSYHESIRVRVRGQATAGFSPNDLTAAQGYFSSESDYRASVAWVGRLFMIEDALRTAFRQLDAQDDPGALVTLSLCGQQLEEAERAHERPWLVNEFFWEERPGAWNEVADRRVTLTRRSAQRASTVEELRTVEAYFDPRTSLAPPPRLVARLRSAGLHHVLYLRSVLVPYLRATIAAAAADHALALRALAPLTGYGVGVAEADSPAGYRDPSGESPDRIASTLPYTTFVGFDEDGAAYADTGPSVNQTRPGLAAIAIAPFELRFFRLVQGEVMLAWADELYRADDDASIRRARELYKGVVLMHGDDPGIAPDFPRPGVHPRLETPGLGGRDPFTGDNPARRAQIARARLALFQIDQGLNAYGWHADLVPILRYRPLALAAGAFVASAKGAQDDYLSYFSRFEQAQLDRAQAQRLAMRAAAAVGITAERMALAVADVGKAQEQVAAVEAQIAAKEAEIADRDSLFGQFSDFLTGAKDSLTSLVPALQKADGADAPASVAGSSAGGDLLGGAGQGITGAGGGAAGKGGGAAGALGAGGAAAVAFGAFAYAGYTSIQGIGEAGNRRLTELATLRTTTLAAARAQVRLRERESRIAQLEQGVAAAERAYAGDLLRFERDRFLNAEFWQRLAALANRQMRRYVTLGARTAWLAERALAFEQARRLDIIRLDYLPARLRGVTGADRLRADLAELEAARLDGVRLRVPIRHSISVARDFPLAFGALKTTGRCRLRAREADLRQLYPGTFAHRVRAVSAAADAAGGPLPRGILRNGGISLVGARDGTPSALARFPDALPISEFNLRDDAAVYGLPDERLLQFEGSGYETEWELVLPADANGPALRALVDVVLTFDLQADYADGAQPRVAGVPGRMLLLAASAGDPGGLRALRDPAAPARLAFDPRRVALPAAERNRRLANVAVLCLGAPAAPLAATMRAGVGGPAADFTIARGVGLSNAGALLGGAAPLPLNALADVPLDQPFTLEFARAGVQLALRELLDVVLVLDYVADAAP